MNHFRLAGVLVAVSLGVLALPLFRATAQTQQAVERKQETVQRLQAIVDERLIETQPLQKKMPLALFLDVLEKQLPEGKKVALRLDREALGSYRGEIAATPIIVVRAAKRMSLAEALGDAISKIKTKIDYRVEPTGLVLTTPREAQYTIIYDIRDLVERPGAATSAAPVQSAFAANMRARPTGAAQRAAQLIHALVSATDPEGGSAASDLGSIRLLNDTRLVIHASGTRHAAVASILQAFRRLADVAVAVRTDLYEVSAAFYFRLKSAKRLALEEAEQRFLAGRPRAEDSLFKILNKQVPIQAGDEVKVDNGEDIALLSRHSVYICGPGPDQAIRREKARQTVLHGVGFRAGVQVSSDRRFVQLDLTEKAAEIQEIQKVKRWDASGTQVDFDVPFLKNATHSQVLEIPDGGCMLVAVYYRPPAVRAKNRWWILAISPRIVIEEEERQIRQSALCTPVTSVPVPRPASTDRRALASAQPSR